MGCVNPVILGGKTVSTIKRLLGITAMSMKMDALAKHLKIRFKLVPEHYKCEETGA